MSIKARNRAQTVYPAADIARSAIGEADIAAVFRGGEPGPLAANPSGTDRTITKAEDVLYVFSLADFGFSDGGGDNDQFAGVLISTEPTNGSLAFDGGAIGAGSIIIAADIVAGRLTFESNQNTSGLNYASFTFRVGDSAGEVDPSPNTITVNVTSVNDAPLYRNFNSGSAGSFNEGQTTPIFLDMMHNGLVEDVDSADFGGGFLRVSITQGGTPAQDKLGIDTAGTVAVSGTAAGSTVSVGGVLIGTIAAGGTGVSEDLVVNFNAAATLARVQTLVRALTYFNTAENPTSTTRLATISLNDGDGPQSSPVSLTIGLQTFNDAPVLTDPTVAQIVYLPGQPLTPLWTGVTMTDPDDQASFVGGNIQMSAGSGGSVIELMGARFVTQNAGGMTVIVDSTTSQQIGQLSAFGGSLQVFNLTSAATSEVVNALIRSFGFRTEGANPSLGNFQASLTFFDGFSVFGGGITSNMVHQTITVGNPSPVPIVDLNGTGFGVDAIATYSEGGTPVGLAGLGNLVVLDADGGNQLDKMTVTLFGPQPSDILTWGSLPAGVTVEVVNLEFQRIITFTGAATPGAYQTLLESFRYSSSSDTPPSQRSLQVSVHSDAVQSAVASAQIYITPVDDLGTARDDYFFAEGTGIFISNVGFDNGFGPDLDPDGFIELVAVNGSGTLNTLLDLPSGAKLWVGSFGGITLDPNGAYSGPAVETFTYTLRGGSTATATIFVAAPGASVIQGTAADDVLTSTAAGDILIGKEGNDTYFVDSAGDRVVERAGQGYDVLAASLSYTLTAGAHIDLMTTGWIEGMAAINLAGNELDQQIWGNGAANIITGNDGDDTLFGFGGADTLLGNAGKDVFFGGAGADDSLYGGIGDDTYFADDSGDVIVETGGEGQDVAAASVDYVLGAGVSVELMTTGWIGGTFTLALTGNELGNEIWGNDGVNALHGGGGNATDALLGFGGNDRLDGGGGLDLLVGGTGQDSFVFANALNGAEADIVADFNSTDDTILLDDAVFTGLSVGGLNANAFVTGSAALDADDRILYDAATGKLYFDADGNGAGAAVQFATISGNPVLTAADFQVI